MQINSNQKQVAIYIRINPTTYKQMKIANTLLTSFLNSYRKNYIPKIQGKKEITMQNQILKAALYCRTATNNYSSLNNQQKQLMEYASKIRAVPITFFEIGTSGICSMKDRPTLNHLLKLVRENKLDIIIIDSLSRLSRNANDCLYIYEELRKSNVKLIVLDLLKGSINNE